MPATFTPVLSDVRRHSGVAGQFSVTATVRYPDLDDSYPIEFIGSVYGGPVVMKTDAAEVFVSDPGRFGEFGSDGPGWVRRFFAD